MSELVASQSLTEMQICDLLDRAAKRRRLAIDDTTREVRSSSGAHADIRSSAVSSTSRLPEPYITSKGAVAKVGPQSNQQSSATFSAYQSQVQPSKPRPTTADVQKKITAGTEWFDLPATEMTAELKRDLQLLQMRSVLDPHRHYKKNTTSLKAPPKFSQVGTIIEGPTEFFSARLTNRERKVDLLQEALNAEKANPKLKGRFETLQVAKQSGGKSYYRNVRNKRLSKGKR